MNLFDGIRISYLANGLADEEVKLIAEIAEDVSYVDLGEIMREYDPSEALFVLLEGKVRVTTSTGDFIARLKPGQVIGETALFDKGPRSATVLADGLARLALIPASKFEVLMNDQPVLGVKVMRNLGASICSRLRSSNIQLESVLATL
jgi:CRP-like cAMP-binding protein